MSTQLCRDIQRTEQDYNYLGNALLDAIEAKDSRQIINTIRLGADINFSNSYGETPLHMAAQEGQSVVLNILINLHANVNAVNVYGDSPIFYGYKHQHVIETLLSVGARVDIRNREGSNYWNWAASITNPDKEMVQ